MSQDIAKDLLYALKNPIDNAYKDNVPVNIRMLIKSVAHPTPINENNLSEKEQDLLRDAYTNSRYRVNSPSAKHFKDVNNSYEGLPINALVNSPFSNITGKIPVKDAKEWTSEVYSNGLQYDDYQHDKKRVPINFPAMNAAQMLKESYTNPAYAMATAIGRADINNNIDGNVHMTDDYDFKSSPPTSSKAYKAIHDWAQKNSNPMHSDINLGQASKMYDRGR